MILANSKMNLKKKTIVVVKFKWVKCALKSIEENLGNAITFLLLE